MSPCHGRLRSLPAAKAAPFGSRDLLGSTVATFALTIINHATIIAFAAMFAGLGLAETSGWTPALTVTLGVIIGSMLWWVLVDSRPDLPCIVPMGLAARLLFSCNLT